MSKHLSTPWEIVGDTILGQEIWQADPCDGSGKSLSLIAKIAALPDSLDYDKRAVEKAHALLFLAAPAMLEALKAIKAYDAAIQRHACKGESFVQGDDLDALYDDFITKTNKALSIKEGGRYD